MSGGTPMGPVRAVVTPRGRYDVVDGDRLRGQALVVAPIVDEGLPSGYGDRSVRVQPQDPHVYGHITGTSLVLSGRAELALAHLDAADQLLHVRVFAAGLPAQDVELRVPMGSALPFGAPAVVLATPPTAVAGRVVAAAFPYASIAAAEITVGGPVPAGRLVGLRCPLSLPHDAGTVVRGRTLNLLASTAVTVPALAGEQHLTLAATASVSAGRVLELGPVESREHAVVDSVDAATNLVFLRAPLRRSLPAGAAVSVTSTGPIAGLTALRRAGNAGDGVLVTAADLAEPVVEMADPVAERTEFRATGCRTDADGYWRLDGVRGVPAVDLTTVAAGFVAAGPTTYPLDPRHDPNVIDIELTV